MDILSSPEYKGFRASVPLRKVIVDGGKEWQFYDAGPRSISNPIVFLPPVTGTADVFFRQLLALSAAGCRAISINHPVVWSVDEWCSSFNSFLNSLSVDRVHIFGASLGGFLAMKFAEYSGHGRRVQSLVLCNAFNDTTVFQQTNTSSGFWAMPAVMLKKLIIGSFDVTTCPDMDMLTAVQFMNDKMDSLSQQELASRLTINCSNSYVQPQEVQVLSSHVTIIVVLDKHALTPAVYDELFKLFPDARKAHLKSGGNFPYLSRSDEVNIFTQIHLQQFCDTVYSAMEPRSFNETVDTREKEQVELSDSEDDD